MVKFKCNNCGNVFSKFCDTEQDSKHIKCPSCGSHWIIVDFYSDEKEIIFPSLPYPNPSHPYVDPWPRSPVLWCNIQ